MQLPPHLQLAIEREAAPHPNLRAAAQALSDAYRAQRPPKLDTDQACAAYAATRLPATYAAAHRVLAELAELAHPPATILDLGAGAGAASHAAAAHFPQAAITQIERSARLRAWSQRLGPSHWNRREADLTQASFPPSDLVIFSYSLGELRDPLPILQRAWTATQQTLIVIEPGTQPGFATILAAREHLRPHLAAPCPHREGCPLANTSDWCHFAARVERSALHRRLKQGELSYEDEKFSYAIFTKHSAPLAEARILRHPQIRAGLIELSLCQPEGLRTTKVTKLNKDAWRHARKAEWGDRWPPMR